MKVLLTGATGFIGKTLLQELQNTAVDVSVVLRNKVDTLSENIVQFVVGDFNNNPDFSTALKGVDCVIHLAGRAHVIDLKKSSVLDEFRRINTHLTLNLANQAIKAGVRRLIFLSSIRVNGNQNTQPFLETDTPNPQESYAISKFEAEQGLLELSKKSVLEVVIIRPPLVYGVGAPGNFGRLLAWANKPHPTPLPLGWVNNKRSLVAIDNLVNFIMTCITHQKASNEVFLISDGQDVSTTQLLRKIAQAFDKKVNLLPIPVSWMVFAASLLGKKADAVRLFSSLQVDSSKGEKLLDWRPIVSMEQQLKKIANGNYSKKNI